MDGVARYDAHGRRVKQDVIKYITVFVYSAVISTNTIQQKFYKKILWSKKQLQHWDNCRYAQIGTPGNISC